MLSAPRFHPCKRRLRGRGAAISTPTAAQPCWPARGPGGRVLSLAFSQERSCRTLRSEVTSPLPLTSAHEERGEERGSDHTASSVRSPWLSPPPPALGGWRMGTMAWSQRPFLHPGPLGSRRHPSALENPMTRNLKDKENLFSNFLQEQPFPRATRSSCCPNRKKVGMYRH